MEAVKVLGIVQREILAIGQGWRMDWSDFDGRNLRHQLRRVSEFASNALKSEVDLDFTGGTEFLKEKSGENP